MVLHTFLLIFYYFYHIIGYDAIFMFEIGQDREIAALRTSKCVRLFCEVIMDEYFMRIALNEAKSKIMHTNHLVLIDKYQERFEEATSLLQELYSVITTQPMDVTKCNELLGNVKQVIEKLLADAESDSTDHDIAENAIVFANQYRNMFSTVAEALVVSEDYFNKGEFRNSIIKTTDVLKEYNPRAYDKYMEQR